MFFLNMEVVREKLLPPVEERRRILEQAGVILAEARALAHLLDDQRDADEWSESPVPERHIIPRFFI